MCLTNWDTYFVELSSLVELCCSDVLSFLALDDHVCDLSMVRGRGGGGGEVGWMGGSSYKVNKRTINAKLNPIIRVLKEDTDFPYDVT